MYIKFDDKNVGSPLKDSELMDSVPIPARTKSYQLKKGKSNVIAERKQFLWIIDHAITVHKLEGSTLP